MKTRSRSVLTPAALIAALAVVAVVLGAVLLDRQLSREQLSRAVAENRQLAVGLTRHVTEHIWRTREEFVYSLTNLPYEALLREETPPPAVLVAVRRFLSLNQDLIVRVDITGPGGNSRSVSIDRKNYLTLGPLVAGPTPPLTVGCVALDGVVQADDASVRARVTAVVDPARFWRATLTSDGPNHPNLWFHLLDLQGRPVAVQHGGVAVKGTTEFSADILVQLRDDLGAGYEGDLAQTVTHGGEPVALISVYAPTRVEGWSGLLVVSAEEDIVLGPARNALQLLTGIAGVLLLLLATLFAFFARHSLETQRQIEDARTRLKALLDTVQSGILLVRPGNDLVIDVNPAAVALLGEAPDSIVGRRLSDLLPGAEQPVASREIILQRDNAAPAHILATTAELELAEGRHLLCSFVDVTPLREALARAESAARAARSANEAKTAFLSMMSHELRTPLTSILGLTQLLTERVHGPLTDEQDKYLRVVLESGRRLLDLINKILDVSKINLAGRDLVTENVPLRQLCESALRAVSERAAKAGVAVEGELPAATVQARVDPLRLLQILDVLLDNAVKFTPAGGRAGLSVTHDEHEIHLCVWDAGIGIASEHHARVFTPFVQIDSRLAREYGGSGLSLALVQQLVTAHGGRIELVSAPGKGSAFTVVLPR